MAKSVFDADRFHNEEAAFTYVEAQLWPEGPVCPHCGSMAEKIGKLEGVRSKPSKKNPEGVVQIGLRKCYACRGPAFTIRKGTIFEDSHLPLHLWLQAIHLLCASKKGISTRQLQRMLGCGLKTAWHLGHRIREAMREGKLGPMGGTGQIVEVDETYIGRRDGVANKRVRKGRGGWAHKNVVLTLVHRGGSARSFHVDGTRLEEIVPVVRENIARESRMMPDEAKVYVEVGTEFASHESVVHSKEEYVRGDVTTNTVEGYFSVFKRGMRGVYQHCGQKHLHRYLAEFDFRYNNRIRLGVDDNERADRALQGVKGKRLTYRATGSSEAETEIPF